MKDTESQARILGVSAQMQTFQFFYGVVLGELILRHCDNRSRTLQKESISAAQGQEVADLTVKTLRSIRSDQNFELFWENTQLCAKTLDIACHVNKRFLRGLRVAVLRQSLLVLLIVTSGRYTMKG